MNNDNHDNDSSRLPSSMWILNAANAQAGHSACRDQVRDVQRIGVGTSRSGDNRKRRDLISRGGCNLHQHINNSACTLAPQWKVDVKAGFQSGGIAALILVLRQVLLRGHLDPRVASFIELWGGQMWCEFNHFSSDSNGLPVQRKHLLSLCAWNNNFFDFSQMQTRGESSNEFYF